MKYCYLCTQPFHTPPTWRSLLTKTFPTVICDRCASKFERAPIEQTDKHVSLYVYNDAMKNYLHQYKFLQDVALAQVFAQLIYEYLSKQQAIIVPIPLHPKKLIQRTFAQVDELLRAANIPFTHVLEKTSSETQSTKTLQQRLSTPQLFTLKQNMMIEPTTYVLVDDIRTTGTTLQHAEKVLKNSGAKEVYAFTLIKG